MFHTIFLKSFAPLFLESGGGVTLKDVDKMCLGNLRTIFYSSVGRVYTYSHPLDLLTEVSMHGNHQ